MVLYDLHSPALQALTDSVRARLLLHDQQQQLYGSARVIPSHSPTRFASLFFVLQSLLRNKKAFQDLVTSEQWPEVVVTSPAADVIRRHCLLDDKFWENLAHLRTAMEPITDAIHEIEADKPLLAQVGELWHRLSRHLDEWHFSDNTPPEAKADLLHTLFHQRWRKHFHAAFTLAQVLDPLQFEKTSDGRWTVDTSSLLMDDEDACLDLLRRLSGPGNEEAVVNEWVDMGLSPFPKTTCGLMERVTKRVTHPQTGKVSVAPASERKAVWVRYGAKRWPHVGAAALRLFSMHATTGSVERNWSVWRHLFTRLRSRLGLDLARQIVFIRGNLTNNTDKDELEELILSDRTVGAADPGPSTSRAATKGRKRKPLQDITREVLDLEAVGKDVRGKDVRGRDVKGKGIRGREVVVVDDTQDEPAEPEPEEPEFPSLELDTDQEQGDEGWSEGSD